MSGGNTSSSSKNKNLLKNNSENFTSFCVWNNSFLGSSCKVDEVYSKPSVTPFYVCTLKDGKGLVHLGAKALKGFKTSEKQFILFFSTAVDSVWVSRSHY